MRFRAAALILRFFGGDCFAGAACPFFATAQRFLCAAARAVEIWKSLGEPEGLADARWEAIKLTVSLPEGDLQLLERHPARVRVIAYDRHQERLSKLFPRPASCPRSRIVRMC